MFKERFEPAIEELTPEEVEKDLTPQEAEKEMFGEEWEITQKEIKEMPEQKKFQLGRGLSNLGYASQEIKGRFFGGVLEKVSSLTKEKGAMNRFLNSYAEQYTKQVEQAKRAREKSYSGKLERGAGILRLGGNILRYGRILWDLNYANPLRHVMAASMLIGRTAEAAKEARFKNEEVIDKTRVKDIDAAAEEAWKIHQEAEKKAEAGKEVSKEDLDRAYRDFLPEDLKKRLQENPDGVASNIVRKVIQKDIEWSVKRIDKKLTKIEQNEKLSAEERELRKEQLLKRQEKFLQELDGMVANAGTIDLIAYGCRMTEKTGKAVTIAMMIDTIGRLPQMLSSITENVGAEEIPEGGKVIRMPIIKEEVEVAELEKEEVEVPPEIKEPVPEELVTPVERPSGPPVEPIDIEAEEAEAKAAEIAPEVLERGLEANFTLELGQGEVPAQLERVFHMMAIDHMKNVVNFSDDMFSELNGAKSLNMAANLVKLAEGNDIAGIEAEDFAEVVAWDAKTGILEIKDHVKFNQIVDDLEKHADGLWDRGILQKGTVAYLDDIKKDTWEKIIHAQGLDKVEEIETGIEGHDEIGLEQITDFDKSKMVQEAEEILEKAKGVVTGEELEKAMQQLDEMEKKGALEEALKQLDETEKIQEIKTLEDALTQTKEIEDAKKAMEALYEAEKIEAMLSAEAKSILIEKFGFTSGEVGRILDEKLTVGKLLEEIPRGISKTEMYHGHLEDMDLPWHGQAGYGEFGRYWKLAEGIRKELPLVDESVEAKEMTVGDLLRKIARERVGERAVNIEM
ncbi:MAG: hypothetical protein ISS88_00570 [Candidatus Portnoybacteria bacterium]|nr:hypothetical protein [Candidatus Portnoybacteria bacterium]